jgi:hypothetical protein
MKVETSDTPAPDPVVEDVKRKRKKSHIALEEEEINAGEICIYIHVYTCIYTCILYTTVVSSPDDICI